MVAYEDEAISSAPALFAVDRLARPGSQIIGNFDARTLLSPGLDYSVDWEFEAQQSLARPLPTSAAAIYRLVRSQRVGWVLVAANGDGSSDEDAFVATLIRAHGELAYAAENWYLYRLVAVPTDRVRVCARGTNARTCVLTKDIAGPWTITEVACNGRTYELSLVNRGVSAWTVFVLFSGTSWDSDYTTIAGGSAGSLYATAPTGRSDITVSLSPAGKGGEASEVTLKTTALGTNC
jgi:hypothetical protein